MANSGDPEHEDEVSVAVGTIRRRGLPVFLPLRQPRVPPRRHWTVRAELTQL